jgi:hypothetical protein
MVFGIIPECCSASARNGVRLQPGIVFGLPRNTQLEELEDELGATPADLSRYRCPHCSAEMTASGGYPIDEHNKGDYEQFSCGHGRRDGRVVSLCPTDPKFPKLEDFELVMSQTKSGEWICWPKPKTQPFPRGGGPTAATQMAQEAAAAVEEPVRVRKGLQRPPRSQNRTMITSS